MKFLNSIVKVLLNKNVKLLPCSKKELEKLEKDFNVSFPLAYREFLLCMGKGAGDFLKGSSCFYNSLYKLNDWAHTLLKENGINDELPEDCFVFWMHQGYQFAFFRISNIDNPEVYYFNEGNEPSEIRLLHSNLVSFFEEELKLISPLLRETKQNDE